MSGLLNDMVMAFNEMAKEKLVRKVGDEFKQVVVENSDGRGSSGLRRAQRRSSRVDCP